MTQLAQEIAVLDGLDDVYGSSIDIDPTDGRIGQRPATGMEYTQPVLPGVRSRMNVIDASEGANYGGGSSYATGMPLMPSSVGLADAEFEAYMRQGGTLPERRDVIDPSGGSNYTGGAAYSAGVPLTVSSAGLAEMADLKAASEALDPTDGRIGQRPAYGTEYSQWVQPGVRARMNVIDASEGANYSGGSSHAAGLPLMPSSVGLADADIDNMDDEDLGLAGAKKEVRSIGRALAAKFKKVAGKRRLRTLKAMRKKAAKDEKRGPLSRRIAARNRRMSIEEKLKRCRALRRKLMAQRSF